MRNAWLGSITTYDEGPIMMSSHFLKQHVVIVFHFIFIKHRHLCNKETSAIAIVNGK
jgi:hypothetical protein